MSAAGRSPVPRPAVLGWRPTLAALIGDAEATWPDASVLAFDITVDSPAARRWLPPQLSPTGRALLFVAHYPNTSFGVPYHEAGLLLEARRRRELVLHCAWMVVDDDSAMIFGRELFGFPKKMADFRWSVAPEPFTRVDVSVARRGEVVVAARGSMGVATVADAAAFPHPIVNVVGLPGPSRPRLMRLDPPQCVHEQRSVDVELTVAGGNDDPLDELVRAPARRAGAAGAVVPARARWLRCDIGVPPTGAGTTGSPRQLVHLAAGAARPVGTTSPRWLIERYLLRAR